MAAPRVLISKPAMNDLDAAWDYLAEEASPETADFVVARLYEAMYRAAETPFLHRVPTEYEGAPRRINIFSYAIFYDPLPDEDRIFVWRILHVARDMPDLVFRPAPTED
jgi:plasmid stabilization system protein ParE